MALSRDSGSGDFLLSEGLSVVRDADDCLAALGDLVFDLGVDLGVVACLLP